MIHYSTSGRFDIIRNLTFMRGSVFPSAVRVATPCALVTCALVHLAHHSTHESVALFRNTFGQNEAVLNDNASFTGFSFLVGFLVVFRTSQSYERFWSGCTLTAKMGAEWFDACSSAIAFSRKSNTQADLCPATAEFQNTLVRLFSMLHAAALADLEDYHGDLNEVHAFAYELIDPMGIDDRSLEYLLRTDCKVELIFQWIQQLLVDSAANGVLGAPPPIISRVFQELANGMVMFQESLRIAAVPFPFPYAQTCDVLLILHWVIVPFVTCQWVQKVIWAGVFCFIQVFVLWSLNYIAIELENPFGFDANDLDGCELHMDMNSQLLMLCKPPTRRIPELSKTAQNLISEHSFVDGEFVGSMSSFREVCKALPGVKSMRKPSSQNSSRKIPPSGTPRGQEADIRNCTEEPGPRALLDPVGSEHANMACLEELPEDRYEASIYEASLMTDCEAISEAVAEHERALACTPCVTWKSRLTEFFEESRQVSIVGVQDKERFDRSAPMPSRTASPYPGLEPFVDADFQTVGLNISTVQEV
eukprot:TRINITY_DN1575_c0_g1_i2.p1 TRINITY_DN1575_c0_g1~~TRINITY_DN1575_c0_g1_i2.p1  ORF type:complete len:558 (+),score=68.77 TRINITY_DN1575_c0_g1_i2:78-1676(+)